MLFWAGASAGALAAGLVLSWLNARRRRRLGRFFSFAAHELNTPLTAVNMTILNFTTGVFGELPEEQKPWFDILREQTIRLAAMVSELRDLVHLEINGDLRLELQETDVEEAVRRALDSVTRGFSQGGAKVRARIEPGLPKISADEDRFARTLISLLHHARKFKRAGDVELRAMKTARGGAAVEVVYPSLPLSDDAVRRSLELLYPADARSGAASATGLGLGLLRVMARRQGGELSLELKDGTAVLRLEMLGWSG